MPSLTKYVRGTVVRIDTTFSERTSVDPETGEPVYTLTDPGTLKFFTEDPNGEDTEYVFPTDSEIVHDGEGVFHAEITPNLKGHWLFRWESTGAAAGAEQGAFIVVDSIIDDFSFLIFPEDHDAIRAVLGIVEADLEDHQIEGSTFARQAEQRIKNRVSNWETQMEDPERVFALRMAAAYATAALIAESYVKGGVVGNVYGPRIPERNTADWNSHAEFMWQRHEEWMAMAEAWDDIPEVTYNLPMVKASGPSKAGQPGPMTIPPYTKGWLARWRGWTV